MDLLPGIPNDVALDCLIRIHFQSLPASRHVSSKWMAEIKSPEFARRRKSSGLAQSLIVAAQAWADPAQKRISSPFYRLVVCDPETSEWTDLPPIPDLPDGLPILCHLAGVGSELVVLGGCDPVTWRVLDSVFIYNFVSGTWRCGASMPGGQRLFFACASDSDRIVYVAGGHDEEKNALRSAMAYDLAEDRWIQMSDMAIARDECTGIFQGGKFHVIGGYTTETQGSFERHAEVFDVATWRWGPVSENFLENTTCLLNCVSCNDGKMYMCHQGNVMVREGVTWRNVARLPVEVCHVDYVSARQGRLLVIGYGKFEEAHTTYVLDLKSCIWSKIEAPKDYLGHVQSGCYLEI